MKNNDDMLTRQGDVYTLVDKDGYLVREDTNGERKKYLLEGEGGGELPENLVTSVNGQTGDVNINIPVLPKNIVNTFNTFTGEVDYPKFVTHTDVTSTSLSINFGGKTYLGEIGYYPTPVNKLTVTYQSVTSSNAKYMKDKYAIVQTSENFTGVTVNFKDPSEPGFSAWITNKEFVMEPNKIYLISCNYPLATIVELENVR